MAAPMVERLAQREVDPRRRLRQRGAGVAAGQRIGADRAAEMRPAVLHRHVNHRARLRRAASRQRRARHGGGQPAPEARLEIARAIDLHADPPGVGVERQPRIGQSHLDVGQAEGGGGIGIAEPVEFAQPQHAIAHRSAQPHPARPHRRHLGRQAGEGNVHLHPLRRQVGMGRIAQHDILDPLRAQPDIDQVVIGLDAAPVEFAADEILGDGGALRPQADQHQGERPGAHAQPAQPCPANRFFAVLFFHSYGQPRLSCDTHGP